MAYSGWISIKGRPGLKWRQDLRLFCLASCLTPSHHSKRKQTPPYQRQFETLSYRAVAHLLRATVYRWLHSLQTTTQSTTVYRWLRSLHMTTVLYRNSPTVPILLLLLTLLQKFSVRAQFCSGWKTQRKCTKTRGWISQFASNEAEAAAKAVRELRDTIQWIYIEAHSFNRQTTANRCTSIVRVIK